MTTSVNWSKIIESVQDRHVIPILGSDVVPVTLGERTTPFQEFLAQELITRLKAAEINVPDRAPSDLPELVREIFQLPENENLARPVVIDPLREHLVAAHNHLMGSVKPASETRSLEVFCELPLIVTAGIDGAAELALNAACGAAPTLLNIKRITTRTAEDLPDSWESRSSRKNQTGPLLYHLFGRIDRQDTFVLTDDEVIESIWKLQGSDAPRLREAFAEHDILLLGSRFPDWLCRFVLRLARGRAFGEAPERSFSLVADKNLSNAYNGYDRSLEGFLSQFRASNVWIDRDPLGFLAALNSKIPRDQGNGPASPPRPNGPTLELHPIFISYASQNLAFAERLAEALRARGLPVWFDQQRLHGAEELRSELRHAIEVAHLFVPLISRVTNRSGGRRVFVEEWKHALDWNKGIQVGLRPYIAPIIVDDLPYSELAGEARKFIELGLITRFASPSGTDPEEAFRHVLDDLQHNYRKVQLASFGL